MSESSVTFVTCARRDESEIIAKALVNGKFAACVNIVPGLTSVYRWEGQMQVADEFLLIIKSQSNRFKDICRTVKENHSYTCPEIISVPIAEGSKAYLNWIKQSVKKTRKV